MSPLAPLSYISPASWRILAGVVAIDFVLCSALGLSVKPTSFLAALGLGLMAYALAWVYTVKRPAPPLAMMAMALAYLVVFTPVGAVASYAFQAFNLPMRDSLYASLDTAMGLDWMTGLAFVNQHPDFALFLRAVYSSSMPHVTLAILALAFTDRHDRLRTYLTLFALTAVVTCFVSGLVPAIGTFAFYAPGPELRGAIGMEVGIWHVAPVNALRDGSLRVIDIARVQGLVTFPSFHTALAIITIWAAWPVRRVGWASAILGAWIIFATPFIGGHYFIDLVGGGAIAVWAVWLVQRKVPVKHGAEQTTVLARA